jgi:hypothetical protein
MTKPYHIWVAIANVGARTVPLTVRFLHSECKPWLGSGQVTAASSTQVTDDCARAALLSRRCHNRVNLGGTATDLRGCFCAGQQRLQPASDGREYPESTSQAEYAGSIPVIGSTVTRAYRAGRRIVRLPCTPPVPRLGAPHLCAPHLCATPRTCDNTALALVGFARRNG